MIKHSRPLADLLTRSRALLGLLIAWLGLWRGREGLAAVCLAVLVSWFSDLIDGPLARRDVVHEQTWVGRHDAEADLFTSAGVALYLTFSGFVAAWMGVGVLMLFLTLWILHSRQLAWPLYAMPYALLIKIVFTNLPVWGWILVAYLMGTLFLRWQRLRSEYLPDFFDAIRSLRDLRSMRQ